MFFGVDFVSYFPPLAMERNTTSTKPVKTFRLRGITASVFKNSSKSDGRTASFHKLTIQRTYKDGESFKNTTSFSRDDWPIIALLGSRAWEYINEAESKAKNGNGES